MANDSTAQQPLTRRELRELEREAQREARLVAAREAEARAARIEAERIEVERRAAQALAAAEPAFMSRRERRLAEAAAVEVAPVGVAPVVAAVEPAAEAPAEPVAPAFLSRRERREAERAAELAAVARLEAESAAAAAQVAVELPELFAVPAPAVDHAPAVAEAPVEALIPVIEPIAERATDAIEPAPAIRPVVSLDAERALRGTAGDELPTAPSDEPELEVAAAFARQGRTVRETRAGRARRIMLDNRRSASAGRFGGSLLAMSFLAGTVVLGAGSAAAIGAIGAQQGEAQAQGDVDVLPEAQRLTVAQSETLAVSAPRSDEATAVTSIGSAAAANLATGVKLPDAKTYTNDITANVQYPFPMGVQMTDMYGPRISPTWGASGWHGGVDFTPGEGTPIGAIADGVVIAVDPGTTTYGVYVEVQHVIDGVQVVSLYAHLESDRVPVKVGDTVSVGDTIGTVGNTGASTGPHLHLEVRVNGDTVDPMYFFEKLNVPGVQVELPTQLVAPNATGVFEKLEQAESHALIDRLFVAR